MATPLTSGEQKTAPGSEPVEADANHPGDAPADGNSVEKSAEGKSVEGSAVEPASATGPPVAADSDLPPAGNAEADEGPHGANRADPHSLESAPLAERLEFQSEQLLDLPTLLDEFVKEGFISQRQAEDMLIAPRSKKELQQHPMEIVAGSGLREPRSPGKGSIWTP